uniref:tetraacyldisaccharide 4'-kinase n=1 Tax=Solanum chacoense TaxID=4108 RepID=A0A0V0HTC6_SOLCH
MGEPSVNSTWTIKGTFDRTHTCRYSCNPSCRHGLKKGCGGHSIRSSKSKNYLPIFLSRLMPLYFLKAGNMSCKLALMDIHNTLVLCVSAIGSADSFVERMKKLEPAYVDRLDFSDHHLFQAKDIDMIRLRLRNLQSEFAMKPAVVVTEKDYDRAPEVLKHLDPYEVLVLCSSLQILPHNGNTEDSFKKCLWQHLEVSNKV